MTTFSLLPVKWSVHSLLDTIAMSTTPRYHALIDTGALITGMSNYEVAEYLLQHGLQGMDGVVFLDRQDRKRILVRANMKVARALATRIQYWAIRRFCRWNNVASCAPVDLVSTTKSTPRVSECSRTYRSSATRRNGHQASPQRRGGGDSGQGHDLQRLRPGRFPHARHWQGSAHPVHTSTPAYS